MTWWRTVLLVAQRELIARRRAALIITAVLVTIAVGVVVLISATTSGGSAPISLQHKEADEVLGSMGVIVMFMAILMTGQVILMGVAEEKNSRVAEVVLGAHRRGHRHRGAVVPAGLLLLLDGVCRRRVAGGPPPECLQCRGAHQHPGDDRVFRWVDLGFGSGGRQPGGAHRLAAAPVCPDHDVTPDDPGRRSHLGDRAVDRPAGGLLIRLDAARREGLLGRPVRSAVR